MKGKATNRLFNLLFFSSLTILLFPYQEMFAQDFDFQEDGLGLVVMEAENYSENLLNGTAEWLPVEEPVDFSGAGAMLAVSDGPFASAELALAGAAVLVYKVNFIYPGPHFLWARGSRDAANAGGTDSFHIGIDESIPKSGTFITFESAFSKEGEEEVNGVWKWIWQGNPIGGQAYVDVPAEGVHEFKIYIRESGFRIDKIVLSAVDYQEGTGYGPPADSIAETLAPTGSLSAKLTDDAFTFYPNPAGDQIRARIRNGAISDSRIGIYDITGKRVRTVSAEFVNSLVVEVSDLNSGVYYLKLEQGGKTVSVQKMLKL